MEGYKCNVGKGILKICMGDNYTDATVVFREYVQNAIDAIYQAEKQGLITNTENYVSIDTNSCNISIQDRGVGVEASKIGPILVDLGNSTKSGNDIGQYGIGRLSGANWCDRIVFETSYYGEEVCSILTFDAKLARELVSQNDGQDCGDVMDSVTKLETKEESADQHYFRVTLENVKEELRNEDSVRDYLSFIAPVPYNENFYDDCQKKAFQKHPEFEELSSKEKICKIHLNGKPVVKPYSSTIYIDSKALRITPPTFFKIDDEDYGDLAWGWYSINEEAKQMGENVRYKGLRLRAKNMAVGPQDYLISFFKNPTDANYVIGEVFVMHKDIHPTGSRDGMKPSREFELLKIGLKSKFKEITSVYNAVSKLGSAALKPIITSHTQIAEYNLEKTREDLTEESKKEIENKIKESKGIVEKAKSEIASKLKVIDTAENADLIKEVMLKHWAKEAQRNASDYNAKAKPGHKINPINIDSIISSAVSDEAKPAKPMTPAVGNSGSVSEGIKPTVEPKDTDKYKQLGKSEYNLMKKVYSVINSESRLDEKTKEKIKNKLEKKILS
ncbi:MAG: hypothetical protein MJZ99_10160 [Bacteroidales bacterium]|nr:hypothetical protein [Bacteroidales bacterium]